jgi:hypothetical protein
LFGFVIALIGALCLIIDSVCGSFLFGCFFVVGYDVVYVCLPFYIMLLQFWFVFVFCSFVLLYLASAKNRTQANNFLSNACYM